MGVVVGCEEKQRLLDDYTHMADLFAASVTTLQKLRSTASLTQYQNLKTASKHAHAASEKARVDLESHISAHGC
jgi:hypothetical protein